MVCDNARAGLPTNLANGEVIPMPDVEARADFARRAARYRAVASKLERHRPVRADEAKARPPRRLPAASPTTGTLTALVDHPRFGRNVNPQAPAERVFDPRPTRIRSFGGAK